MEESNIFNVFDNSVIIDESTVISASAGTGKTTAIIHVVIRSLLGIGVRERVSLKDILLTTFSRNASGEIKCRLNDVVSRLYTLLNHRDFLSLKKEFAYLFFDNESDYIPVSKIIRYQNILSKEIGLIDVNSVYTLMSLQNSIVKYCELGDSLLELHRPYNNHTAEEINISILEKEVISLLTSTELECLGYLMTIWKMQLNDGQAVCKYRNLISKININIKDSLEDLKDKKYYLDQIKSLLGCDRDHVWRNSGKIVDCIHRILVLSLIESGEILVPIKIIEMSNREKEISSLMPKNIHYKYIIIDEAQDMNRGDLTALSIIASSMSSPPITYVVGDPKQSLYAFRGSDTKIFTGLIDGEFRNFKVNPSRVFNMKKSYRSKGRVIDYVNSVCKNFNDHKIKYIDQTYVSSGGSVFVNKITGKFDSDKVESICRVIENLTNSNCENIAVIAHKNADLKKISQVLDENCIKHLVVRNSLDEASDILVRVFDSMKSGIRITKSDTDFILKNLFCLEEITIQDREMLKSAIFSWKYSAKQKSVFSLFSEILNHRNWMFSGRSVESVLVEKGKSNICDDIYYISSSLLESYDIIYNREISVEGIMLQWRDILIKHSPSRTSSESIIKRGIVDSRLELLTVHAAKGLEFDAVVYVDIAKRCNDIDISVIQRDYVALTRAKAELHIFTNDECKLKEDSLDSSKCNFEDLERFEGSKKIKREDPSNENEEISLNKLKLPLVNYLSYSELASQKKIETTVFEMDSIDDNLSLSSSGEIGNIIHKAVEQYNPYGYFHIECINESILENKINQEDKEAALTLVKRCIFSKIFLETKESLHDKIIKGNDIILREAKFYIKNSDQEVIIGIIDTLVLLKNEKKAIVLDWKTGLLPKDKTDENIKSYTNQKYGIQKDLYTDSLFNMYTDINYVEFIFCYPRYINEDGLPIVYREINGREAI